MYENGSIVTLRDVKLHGEGEDAMRLNGGTCGMVVQMHRRKTDNNHEYIVDFGPYGQWYCTHNELSGQEKDSEEGFEPDVPRETESPREIEVVFIDEIAEKASPALDVEADIKRRMKEIENGSY